MSCTGNCSQGRACTCVVSQTELANTVPLDATRTWSPPPYEEPPRGRTLAWTVLALALVAAGLLMLLAPFPAHSQTLVWVGAR